MNAATTNKVINQTKQYLPNGRTISLVFRYQANFKIGDLIEVITSSENMQLLAPQHEEDYFAFDVEIWDDRVRLFCDAKKKLDNDTKDTVFSFRIRDISLFNNQYSSNYQKAIG